MINLDNFQKQAVDSINQNLDVLVVAPTGAGKTLIAEKAIDKVINTNNKKTIYTAPIKALSNQKYHDFSKKYKNNVGLLTGDRSINKDANLLVVTTEILRNMIFSDIEIIKKVGLVILDEVHYLGDKERGSVWEEIIIHLPSNISLVYLSATIANSTNFQEWLVSLRGPTDLITSDVRPVPLKSSLLIENRYSKETYEMQIQDKMFAHLNKGSSKNAEIDHYKKPNLDEVVNHLYRHSLTPSIYFIFSRDKTEINSRIMARNRINRSNNDYINSYSQEIFSDFTDSEKGIMNYDELLWMWRKGISYHHAGMVPIVREFVEHLFSEGFIDVLFATETLSLGINMPAKSVVIGSTYKYDGLTTRPISINEYKQLTGRAGRRGIDKSGEAFILYDQSLKEEWYKNLFQNTANDIKSQFSLSFTSLLGLMKIYDREHAVETLKKSFWAYENKYETEFFEDEFNMKSNFLNNFNFLANDSVTPIGNQLISIYRDEYIPTLLYLSAEEHTEIDICNAICLLVQGVNLKKQSYELPIDISKFDNIFNRYIVDCNSYLENIGIQYRFIKNYDFVSPVYEYVNDNDIEKVANLFDITPGDFVKVAKEVYELSIKLYDLFDIEIFKEIGTKLNNNLVNKTIL